MRYWVYINNEILGPHEKENLMEVPGFSPSTLVCPETPVGEKPADWQPANTLPEISAVLGAPPLEKMPEKLSPASTDLSGTEQSAQQSRAGTGPSPEAEGSAATEGSLEAAADLSGTEQSAQQSRAGTGPSPEAEGSQPSKDIEKPQSLPNGEGTPAAQEPSTEQPVTAGEEIPPPEALQGPLGAEPKTPAEQAPQPAGLEPAKLEPAKTPVPETAPPSEAEPKEAPPPQVESIGAKPFDPLTITQIDKRMAKVPPAEDFLSQLKNIQQELKHIDENVSSLKNKFQVQESDSQRIQSDLLNKIQTLESAITHLEQSVQSNSALSQSALDKYQEAAATAKQKAGQPAIPGIPPEADQLQTGIGKPQSFAESGGQPDGSPASADSSKRDSPSPEAEGEVLAFKAPEPNAIDKGTGAGGLVIEPISQSASGGLSGTEQSAQQSRAATEPSPKVEDSPAAAPQQFEQVSIADKLVDEGTAREKAPRKSSPFAKLIKLAILILILTSISVAGLMVLDRLGKLPEAFSPSKFLPFLGTLQSPPQSPAPASQAPASQAEPEAANPEVTEWVKSYSIPAGSPTLEDRIAPAIPQESGDTPSTEWKSEIISPGMYLVTATVPPAVPGGSPVVYRFEADFTNKTITGANAQAQSLLEPPRRSDSAVKQPPLKKRPARSKTQARRTASPIRRKAKSRASHVEAKQQSIASSQKPAAGQTEDEYKTEEEDSDFILPGIPRIQPE